MAEQSGDQVGQQFGNYQLTRFLGQGGFAEVYLGEHTFLGTQAAIKILRTQLSRDEQEGFLHEARTIAHLINPHIIRVLDFGMQGDQPFLVMDYAANGSLRERHPRGTRVALDTVIVYVKQLATALQYAHDEKLIHRDIKPENILVGRHNEILLSDFGISVVAHSTHSQRAQEVAGSVPYMAPEQLQGRPRPASDQYALGVVVYEWLCGDRPFQGSFTEVYGQHLLAPPPPLRSKNPAIPADIESVVMTALAKDAHQRFANIQAFANALEQAYRSHRFAFNSPSAQPFPAPSPTATTAVASPVQTMVTLPSPEAPTALSPTDPAGKWRTPPRRRFSRRAVLVGGLGLGALAVIGGVAWYELAHRYPPLGTLIYTFGEHNDKVYTVAWHGSRIASGGADQTVQIWDATSGNNPVAYRHHTDSVTSVAWSPDGQHIVSSSDDGTAQVWNASTPASAPIITYKGHMQGGSGRVLAVAWSPNGQYIASGGDDGTVQVWDAVSGRTLFKYRGHNRNSFFPTVYCVAWSPTRLQIASGASDNTVQVWDALTGKNAFVYSGHQDNVNTVAWSPDGSRVASGSGDTTIQVWTPGTQTQAFVFKGHTDVVRSVAWSADGAHIVSGSNDKTAHVWNPNSVAPTAYTYKHHSQSVSAVTWADDSHRIASGSEDKTVQVWEGV